MVGWVVAGIAAVVTLLTGSELYAATTNGIVWGLVAYAITWEFRRRRERRREVAAAKASIAARKATS